MPKLLTVPEVADRLSLSPATVYKYVEKGAIPSCKIGTARRVSEAQIDEFLKKCTSQETKTTKAMTNAT
jgi:excisionase family DNA binding protein